MNTAMKRIQKDIKDLYKNPIDKVFTHHNENNILKSSALIIGPEDTPYQDGFYLFTFDFPHDYPFNPPKAFFHSSRLDTRNRFNPNLYSDGKVCLSILNTWQGDPWTPVQSFSTLLLSMQPVLCKNALLNEPGYGPSKKDIDTYDRMLRHENLRLAVCKVLNLIRDSDDPVACVYKTEIERYFLQHYDTYVKKAKEYMAEDENQKYQIKYCTLMRIECKYKSILEQLENHRTRLLKDYPEFKPKKIKITKKETTPEPRSKKITLKRLCPNDKPSKYPPGHTMVSENNGVTYKVSEMTNGVKRWVKVKN
jgi:ubiquitin-conjugating enzyme E2 Z